MLAERNMSLRPAPAVFKRWSRKGYAPFASLHREVVIGVIKASICYASMLKMKILMNDDHCPAAIPSKGDLDDADGPGSHVSSATGMTPVIALLSVGPMAGDGGRRATTICGLTDSASLTATLTSDI